MLQRHGNSRWATDVNGALIASWIFRAASRFPRVDVFWAVFGPQIDHAKLDADRPFQPIRLEIDSMSSFVTTLNVAPDGRSFYFVQE